MKELIKNILLISLVLITSLVYAQDTLNMAKIEKRVDKYLAYFSNENPGAVVSVMKKGKIIFNKAYGLSNIQTKEKMTSDKLFDAGELSKSFTAFAILKLVEKNKLSLNDHLNNIFPDFPEYGKNITVNNLLDHKSGLMSFDNSEVKTNEDVYEFLKKQDKTVFEAGTKFDYSNSDYPLLALIIEKKSGVSYKEYIRKNLIQKLKLTNTFFIDELENKNIANSHYKEGGNYIVKKKESNIYGEQGIYINTVDYAKFDQSLYTNKILKCESLTKIFKLSKLSRGENISDYSCSWVLMARNGVRYFWQGSGQGGYINLVLHLPDTQTTVLILTNRNDAYDFLKMSIYIAKLFDKDLKL